MIKIFQKIWDEFIYGGHLVAFGSVGIALCYSVISENSISIKLLVGVYLITYIIHLLDRYNDIYKETSNERKKHFENYKGKIQFIIIISLVLLAYVFWDRGLFMVGLSLFMLLIGILYGIFFKGITSRIIGFKSYYTAFAFASIVIFSTFYYNSAYDLTMLLVFLFFSLRWFCNTIFCDIKDIEADKKEKLLTFAIVYGKEKLYKIIMICNLFSSILVLMSVYFKFLPIYSILLSLVPIYSLIYLNKSRSENADYQHFANVWADGESVFWMSLTLLGVIIWK